MHLHDLPLDQLELVSPTTVAPSIDLERLLKAARRRSGASGVHDAGSGLPRSHTRADADEEPLPLVDTVIANTPEQRRAAFGLMSRRYAWRGYQASTELDSTLPRGARASFYVTLLAGSVEKPLGTVTIGVDAAAGLFVDDVNKREVDAVRAKGRRVCELIRLAVDEVADSRRVLASLFEAIYVLGRNIFDVTDVFVEVNPRHVMFYRRIFGFVVAAETKVCPRVGAPSVLLRLDVDQLEHRLSPFRAAA